MKSLKQFIYEMYNKDYDAKKYEGSESHKKYKTLAKKYLTIVGGSKSIPEDEKALNNNAQNGIEIFKGCIQNAIDETNKILKIFSDNGIAGFVNGQMLGRIVEAKLAESMKDVKGFTFEQGSEASNDKDIECKECPKELFELGLGDYAHFYGIELKCSQGTGITGNKSYALDVADGEGKSTKSNKNAFYFLINYKAPIEIPQTVDGQTSKDVANNIKVNNFAITKYTCYFGFIEQNDWVYGDKGNAASLKMGILKNKRLIPIVEV